MRLSKLKAYSPILLSAAAAPLFGGNGCTVDIDGFSGRAPFFGTVNVFIHDDDDDDDFFDDIHDFFDDLDDDFDDHFDDDFDDDFFDWD